ncbi:MAG: hypothetical protein HZB54_06865 [Deltaproteobacteria bacterium]|nr:hypothetical protein [Deltaproteobacteria bacterium]
MFYKNSNEEIRGVVVLTPAESKRLIAKAVKEMPDVKRALKKGRIIIIGGTTNAYVAEEITGKKVDKFWFAAGRVTNGKLGANEADKRINPFLLKNGRVVETSPKDMLQEFTADDVYIKGANAVDANGYAGILMSNDKGGTIGAAMGILNARGSHLIVPVGLEKFVPSVIEAAKKCGQGRIKYATCDKVGMMPLVNAKVMTELQAIDILFGASGVKATHVASGGVAGSEGAVVLILEGKDHAVKKAFDFICRIKGMI